MAVGLIMIPDSLIGANFAKIFALALNDAMNPVSLESITIGTDKDSIAMRNIGLPLSKIFGVIGPCLLSLFLSFSIFINISFVVAVVSELDDESVVGILFERYNLFRVLVNKLILYFSYEF